MSHTPGPWYFRVGRANAAVYSGEHAVAVGCTEADARAIAALPRILQAARVLYENRQLNLTRAGAAGYRQTASGEWVADPFSEAIRELGHALEAAGVKP